MFFIRGPVAQLGARFHGMEEVVGSIPTRLTKILMSGSRRIFLATEPDFHTRGQPICPDHISNTGYSEMKSSYGAGV